MPAAVQVLLGVVDGLRFSVVFAAVAAAVAAGASGYRRAPRWRVWVSAGVLLAGWILGDALRIAGAGVPVLRMAVWGFVSLGLGYVLPTVAGAYVGRQVHKGTGWLSAIVIALTVVAAVAAIVQPVASAIGRIG